jgi:hypothetical protein
MIFIRKSNISLGKEWVIVELICVWLFPGPPVQVINTLSELGYKVVCSTGEAEIVWTLQREV